MPIKLGQKIHVTHEILRIAPDSNLHFSYRRIAFGRSHPLHARSGYVNPANHPRAEPIHEVTPPTGRFYGPIEFWRFPVEPFDGVVVAKTRMQHGSTESSDEGYGGAWLPSGKAVELLYVAQDLGTVSQLILVEYPD